MDRVFDQAVETLRKMLTDLQASEESGVVGVDIVVKRGWPVSVNRKMVCNSEPVDKPVEKRSRFPV
jgi:hypothetical protein